MANADTFDALLEEMHTAALGMGSWDVVLHSIAQLLCSNSVIIHKDLWHGGGWGVRIGADDRAYSDYFGHFAGVQPLASRTLSMQTGSVLTDRMIMPRAEFERTEFYYDWARPNHFEEVMHVRLETNEDALVGLSVTRPRGAREYGTAELRLARRMAPHLRRAVATYESLEEIRRTNLGMMEALDRMRRGVFGLGADGRVVFANQTARTVLTQGDALRIDNGVLAGTRTDQTRIIQRMLESHARGDAPANLILARAGGRPPLRLEPVRLGSIHRLTDLQLSLRLILLVHDPEVDTGALIARLRGRYGLTGMEAAVAFHASQGKGLASVATTLGIGQGTVRSHLKRVFEKTRTNRQAELAWLVSQIAERD